MNILFEQLIESIRIVDILNVDIKDCTIINQLRSFLENHQIKYKYEKDKNNYTIQTKKKTINFKYIKS